MSADLLDWPELWEAIAAADAADRARLAARRKYEIAPHGTRHARLKALQEATNEALRLRLRVHRLRGKQ